MKFARTTLVAMLLAVGSASFAAEPTPFEKTAIVKDAWSAYFKGDLEGALKAFDAKASDAKSKKNAAAADGRGWTLLAMGKTSEARNAFKEALAIDPNFSYSYSGLYYAEGQLLVPYQKAWGLVNLGRFDEATPYFSQAKNEAPNDLHWLIDDGLAWMAYYKGDTAAAEKMFKDVVAKNPKAYLSLTGLGTVAMKKKDYAAAASNLSQSFKLNPYQALASYTSNADTLIAAGQFKEAKDILLMGEYAYPYSADLYYLIARASDGLKDEKVALSSLSYAASLAPFYIDPVFDKIKLTGKAKQTALLSMGWSLYYGGSAAAAIKRFDQYAQAGGTEVSGHLGTGWSQLALTKYPEAIKAFEAANKAGENADALAGLGWVAYAQKDLAAAEKFFNASIKKVPFYASATSGLATLQFGKTALVKAGWEAYFKGDLKGALAAFKAKESEAASANNPVALDGMGWTQLAMGEPKAASASFAAALKIDANYYSSQSGVIAAKRADLVIYNTAWAKLEAGQFDEAKAKFEQARSEMPADIKWLVEDGLAWMAFYKKDYAGAQKAFASIVAANPKAYLSHKGLGYALTELKQYEAASKSLVTAYNLAPYQGVAAFTAPTVKMIDGGAFVDAREVLKLGELIYPYSADIQFLLARAYNGLNNQADADKKALAAVSLAPTYIDPVLGKLKISANMMPVVLSTLGWGNYYAGSFENAIKRFEESTKAGSKDPNNGRGIGFTYYRMGKHKEAVPYLEAAMALEPKTLLPIPRNKPVPGYPFSYWYVEYTAGSILGWVNYRLGNGEKAEKLFAAEVSRNPFSLDALSGLGFAKTLQKDKAGATKYFQEALKVNATYGDALFGLEELKKL